MELTLWAASVLLTSGASDGTVAMSALVDIVWLAEILTNRGRRA